MKKWLSLAANLAPLVLMGIPGMPIVLVPLIVHGIQEAQQIAGASGAAKKAHVLASVTDGIAAVNGVKGKQVVDPAIVTTVVSPAIDTTIGVIKAVQAAHGEPKA